tara:strand:+ start:424 stop:1155 length:732 start_codon:yes stop_codon:yes gene_type:complete
MKISYFHFADNVPSNLLPEASVVVDVLRATTTIAFALEQGAEAVETFADIEQLRHRAYQWPSSSRLMLGERGGKKIDGFDMGNSPASITREVVFGKRLFMSTTNGTRSLERVKESNSLFTLALSNRKAVAEKLLSESPKEIWIVGSGWEGSYSLEDSLAAGALIGYLLQHSRDTAKIANDELTAALALWNYWENDIEGCLRTASHGKRLVGLGNHDADFRCCAQLDQIDLVPKQVEPGVLCAG